MSDAGHPVVILGVPRSGTSMVAGIFAKHGLWVGTCREPDSFNERGHFENLAIKNLMKRWWKGNACTNYGLIATPKPGFRSEVERLLREDGWNGGTWLFKCAPVYYRLFDKDWQPTWVTVRRDPDSIVASNQATGFIPEIEEVLPEHLSALALIEESRGGTAVDADAVVAGDYSSIERALKSAGIDMDEALVSEFVNSELWRFG